MKDHMNNIMTDNNPAAPSQSRGARVLKAIALVAALCLLFNVVQATLVLKSSPSSGPAYGLYHGYADDTEYLFLGSSQIYHTIDAPLLTDEYHLPSYCFSAAGQPIVFTELYLTEFCKYVKPGYVFVDVGTACKETAALDEPGLIRSYAPIRASADKFRLLYAINGGDWEKAFFDCYLPIVSYHYRWEWLTVKDIGYSLLPVVELVKDMPFARDIGPIREATRIFIQSRGFFGQEGIQPLSMKYGLDEDEEREIPRENADAMRAMASFCKENGIELMFIKTPSPQWTKGQQREVEALCAELDVPYLDMHEHLDEIGIDAETDFLDPNHVNTSGAEKVTRYMAEVMLNAEGLRG